MLNTKVECQYEMYGDYEYFMFINKKDVEYAKKDFEKFLNNEGEAYSHSEYKNPSRLEFYLIFFGLDEEDEVGTRRFIHRFICDSESTAKEMERFLKRFCFHDRLKQEYVDMKRYGEIILMTWGEY